MRISKLEAVAWLCVGGLAIRAAFGGDCLLWQLLT
jgi:hypothetical protein